MKSTKLQFARHIANTYIEKYEVASRALNYAQGQRFNNLLDECNQIDWLCGLWLEIAEMLDRHNNG